MEQIFPQLLGPALAMMPNVLMVMCAAQGGVCRKDVGIVAVQVTEMQCRVTLHDARLQGMCIAPNGRIIIEKRATGE